MNDGRTTAVAVFTALLLGAGAAPIVAQTCVDLPGGSAQRPCMVVQQGESRATGELLALSVNAAIGGLTAGVRQWQADRSFLDGFWRGALGGVGTYAGKRIVVSDFDGAGLLGRTVAAAGASVTRNASDGRPMFDRLTLPVGFIRFDWRPARGDLHTSFDIPVMAAVAGIYMSDLGASLDIGRTLGTGAPVFMARNWTRERGWSARQIFGSVLLRGDAAVDQDHDRLLEHALYHERIHVLQYDQSSILWNEPFETALLTSLGSPGWLISRFDFSLVAVGVSAGKFLIPSDFHVWEDEAHFMGRTRGGIGH